MHGTERDEGSAVDPVDGLTPVPSTSLSLRHAMAYRGVDDDGEPVLIITDGVSSVSLETGLAGLSIDLVAAARQLAATAEDFASTMAALLPEPQERRPGRRPPNRRNVPGPRGGTP
jgi:hypothetical protein